jgi:hypothetical protein
MAACEVQYLALEECDLQDEGAALVESVRKDAVIHFSQLIIS